VCNQHQSSVPCIQAVHSKAAVSHTPWCCCACQGDTLAAKLAAFAEALPGVDVEELVAREPLLLRAPDINTVLQVMTLGGWAARVVLAHTTPSSVQVRQVCCCACRES
jgi:hypothetical protein